MRIKATWFVLVATLCLTVQGGQDGKFWRPNRVSQPNLFAWTDTCNTYVLRDGTNALLINLGDGSVLDHLGEIGVKQVEWVLFTDHHRELCQGAARLPGMGARIAVPEAERELFSEPAKFRHLEVTLGDQFTVYGSSYVRPPIQSIKIDSGLGSNTVFEWRGHQITCIDTRGHSPGGMSYGLKDNGQKLVFSGDVMLEGAKMATWFDTEWDYGFAAGIEALQKTVKRLESEKPVVLLPAHGKIIRNPEAQLREYQTKLEKLHKLYLRGYGVEAASVAYQDKVSTPSLVSNVVQVSPRLFKFKRPNFWPNFNLILAESGRALVVDCGLLDERFLDEALEGLRSHYGLKAIDAVIVTHMHGDHFLEAPHLREKWGAQIWALDNMVDKMEHPEWFDYAAPIQAYGKQQADGTRMKGARVDRAFKPGETFTWEGHKFTVDWMPGQTEFALCLTGVIDGQKVAFTGDNIFGDPDDPTQTGHEAVVAHNSAILEEGYIYGAEYLTKLKPDVLVGGHSFVMGHPTEFIKRYRNWAYQMKAAFQDLSPEKDYRYWFDPFWVRAEPYRITLSQDGSSEVKLSVRNFKKRSQSHRIEIHTPPGVIAEPAVLTGKVGAQSRSVVPVKLKTTSDAVTGLKIIAFDVTLDGQRYGERFDLIIDVQK